VKTRKQKITALEALKSEFTNVGSAYLVDFKGMTVSEDAELREAVAKAKITYRVVKNTLARLAVEGTPLEPTAIATTPDDPVTTAKVLTDFAKHHAKFVFKAGIVDGRVIDVADIETLATMPSKEELISKMMFVINSGAQRLATVTSAVARDLTIVVSEAKAKER
jgi:large subunit ribosomal protein L10